MDGKFCGASVQIDIEPKVYVVGEVNGAVIVCPNQVECICMNEENHTEKDTCDMRDGLMHTD